MSLRPYQKKAVIELSGHYKAGLLGVILVMPTGSGKTRTATFVVDQYNRTGRQVLWIVHREELLMQAAMTFAENGIEHRMICSASSERAIKIQEFRELGRSFVSQKSNVVIASIQTIVRRLDQLPWLNPAQIVADECHLSLAATWRKVIGHWPNARLLGLTATPTRLDSQSFARLDGGLYDAIIIGPTPSELVEVAALAPCKVYAPPIQLNTGIKIGRKGNDFDPDDLAKELDSPVIYGDVVKHYRDLSHGKPAIAFCPTVASAKKFADAFCAAGYLAIALDGTTDDAVRRDALQQLGNGEIDVVTSVSILVEGTDVPYATTALMLRRSESLVFYLQSTGRVRRPHPDKDFALVLDFVGITSIHGLPDDSRDWSLHGAAKRSSRADNDNGPDVNITTCTKCFTIFLSGPECPNCGAKFTPKKRSDMRQVDGQLIELTDRHVRLQQEQEDKRRAKEKRMREEYGCNSLEELKFLAEQRGYDNPSAWAWMRWKHIRKSKGSKKPTNGSDEINKLFAL